MTMRSLYDLHEEGGDAAAIAEQFASQWHADNWNVAEDHWEQLVSRMLKAKAMDMHSTESALRQAEMIIQNFAAASLPARGSRCPICATNS
ncbi:MULTISPECIES: DUF6313 family protein [unclassified Streptomyces]|uniref:DUF6313 family protein n=1 Tax=unclassified Streptomyces TaxID=2593676 RepID=UPI003656A379